jgi:hypothetical protein
MGKIKYFFSGPAPAGQQNRSSAGLFVSVLIVPFLLGVTACGRLGLPVPVGNPEKSRIDPSLSGVWMGALGEEATLEAALLVLEPYDKRTWYGSWIGLEKAAEEDDEVSDEAQGGNEAATDGETQAEITDEPDIEELLEAGDWPAIYSFMQRLLRGGEVVIDSVMPFKGWLTKIKGERFITWEPKMVLWSEEAMTPDRWLVFRLRVIDKDHIILDFINSDLDDFDEVQTRKEAEKIIRKNIDNAELYIEDSSVHYLRVAQEDYELLDEMLEEQGISSKF